MLWYDIINDIKRRYPGIGIVERDKQLRFVIMNNMRVHIKHLSMDIRYNVEFVINEESTDTASVEIYSAGGYLFELELYSKDPYVETIYNVKLYYDDVPLWKRSDGTVPDWIDMLYKSVISNFYYLVAGVYNVLVETIGRYYKVKRINDPSDIVFRDVLKDPVVLSVYEKKIREMIKDWKISVKYTEKSGFLLDFAFL